MKSFWFVFSTGIVLFFVAAFGIALDTTGNIIDHIVVRIRPNVLQFIDVKS